MSNVASSRIAASDSALAVVDVQDKLLALIPQSPALLTNLSFLLDAASLLEVPVLATEQYPKGLGPTALAIAAKLPQPIPAKVAFSCCGSAEFVNSLSILGRSTVVVVGIETHVCVLQTTLDLIERGFRVVVPADAVSSRFALDHDLAVRRLERAGAQVTTVETLVFEWTGSAANPHFKAVSSLVQDRTRRLRESSSAEVQA